MIEFRLLQELLQLTVDIELQKRDEYVSKDTLIVLQVELVRIKNRLVRVKHLLNHFSFLVEQINFQLLDIHI